MSKKKDKNDTILVISDLHSPYTHLDAIPFLAAIKKKYKPTRIVIMGDETDKHAMSFHDSDPELFSAGHELNQSIETLKPLYKLFPEADILDSNHGSMIFRKAKVNGIPRSYIRDYRDVLNAPKKWKWHVELNIKYKGKTIKFRHMFKKNPLIAAQQAGCCVVQSHYHEDFSLQYAGNSEQLLWAMTVGCLVDDDSLAFAYNNANLKRPIIGTGIIINGQPQLIPMILSNKGRWIEELI